MRIKFIATPTVIRGILVGIVCLLSINSNAQYSRISCEEQIIKLRKIYIVILNKMVIMPPLAQLSAGIIKALDEGVKNLNSGNYQACVDGLTRNIKIVEGYAK
jgi:hypothetical protein